MLSYLKKIPFVPESLFFHLRLFTFSELIDMTQDQQQLLRKHNVIGDVLPLATTGFAYDMKVQFRNATLDAPGQELGREETQDEPKIFLSPIVCNILKINRSITRI
jgi:hypothetical protein